MFERYTEKARRAIFFARREAGLFGSPYIESEHLLLGLLGENKALLHAHGGTIESVLKQIEAQTPLRERIPTSIDLPVSDECERIFVYAAQEASHLSHKHIGTEHLVLGVLRVQDCFAAALLRERGITLEMYREQVQKSLSGQLGTADTTFATSSQPLSPKSPGLPSGYRSQRVLYNNATETLILELHPGRVFLSQEQLASQRLQSRIFVRHKDKESYEQVGAPPEEVSYESPVTCESLPVVMFNSVRRSRAGADWEGIYSYNLNNKELKLCISPERLRLSEAPGRLCIRELISLSEDAQTVRVNMAIETIASGTGIIHNHLANVDLRDQQVSLLSQLLDTRF